MPRITALLLSLVALAAPAAAAAAGPAATRASLERQMRSAGASSGVLAIDVDTGTEIASVRPDAARIPASVQKLYTTATALARFGPDGHLITTVVAAKAPDTDGVIDGLWLRGGGNPALDSDSLRELAELVAASGVTVVEGDLVADESAFDTLRGPPSEGYRASIDIAPLSALAYVRRFTGARKLAVIFRRSLKRAGVRVAGRALVGKAPAEPVVLAQHESPAMAELARRSNVPSDNWVAELLLKALGNQFGARGSTAAGARVVQSTLRSRFGFAPRVADGSGLSRGNRTTPRQVVRLLDLINDRDESDAFDRSLAVAGLTGTLHDRMRRTAAAGRCRGKTGTIRGVSNLAGYCDTRSGVRVAFAILMNGVNPYGARKLQDKMVSALARYSPSS